MKPVDIFRQKQDQMTVQQQQQIERRRSIRNLNIIRDSRLSSFATDLVMELRRGLDSDIVTTILINHDWQPPLSDLSRLDKGYSDRSQRGFICNVAFEWPHFSTSAINLTIDPDGEHAEQIVIHYFDRKFIQQQSNGTFIDNMGESYDMKQLAIELATLVLTDAKIYLE